MTSGCSGYEIPRAKTSEIFILLRVRGHHNIDSDYHVIRGSETISYNYNGGVDFEVERIETES